MADASRHKLYIIAESDYGVTPATPEFIAVRHSGSTLGLAKGSQLSEELRADRQIADYRHGTRQVGGDISFELSYGGAFDVLLPAVLCGAWANLATGTATRAIGSLTLDTQPLADDELVIGARTYTFADAADFDMADEIPIGATLAATKANILNAIRGLDGVNTINADVTMGDFVANVAVVTAIAAGTAGNSIVTTIDSTGGNAFAAGTLSGGAAAGALAQTIIPGTVRTSFSVLRVFDDMGPTAKKYHLYKGVEFNNFQLGVTPDGLVTGSFTVIGRDAELSDDPPAGATFLAPTTSRVFNGFGGSVSEGGAAIGVATEIQLTLENGIEPRFVIGSDLTIEPSIGRCNLTGTLGAWFEDAALIGKFYEEENSSITFTLTDPEGNSYIFTVPNISFMGGQPDVSGQAAIPLSIPFQAVYDATLAGNFSIAKVPA